MMSYEWKTCRSVNAGDDGASQEAAAVTAAEETHRCRPTAFCVNNRQFALRTTILLVPSASYHRMFFLADG